MIDHKEFCIDKVLDAVSSRVEYGTKKKKSKKKKKK